MKKKLRCFKNSGVTWIGNIPEDWDTNRNKHFFKRSKNVVGENSSKYKVLSLTKQGVLERDIESNSGKMPASFDIYQIINPNSLLLCLFDIDVTPRTIGFVEQTGIVSSAYTNIEITKNDIIPKYYYYWFLMLDMDKRLLHLTKNLRYSISIDEFMALPVIKPSMEEQQAIVDFLDEKNQQIDAILHTKQKLISLLQDKRQALIHEAVTKGLNRDAPMKDSGIEWLGNVPVHWKYLKTKYVAKMKSGHTPSRKIPEYWKDCYIPWVSLSDVHQLRSGKQEYLTETTECISKLGLNNSSAELLPEKTVILSRTASVGFSGIISKPMATTQDFVNWVCGPKILPEYLLYVFRSMKYEFNRLNMGSTHKTIYMPDALNFSTPLPSINEQSEIVEYIRKKAKSIDLLEEKIIALIKNLSDYRQSLISEVVTGKIDVRDYAKEVVQ